MKYWVSDTHWSETRITPAFNPFFRPFKSVKEQNETMVAKINSIVGKDDELFHIGDVSVDIDGIKFMDKIKCKNRTLILGNYDVDDPDKMPVLLKAFNHRVFDSMDFSLGDGTWIHMNHYPTKAVDNMFNIVGHIHGLWKVQPNMVNVGVDAWHFLPVSLDQIKFVRNAIEKHYDANVFPCIAKKSA